MPASPPVYGLHVAHLSDSDAKEVYAKRRAVALDQVARSGFENRIALGFPPRRAGILRQAHRRLLSMQATQLPFESVFRNGGLAGERSAT